MANQQNRKFTFGFLNNNQDAVDLKAPEATLIDSLDADRLALGTLEKSAYIKGTEEQDYFGAEQIPPAANGTDKVEVSGTTFFILQEDINNPPDERTIQYKDKNGTDQNFPNKMIQHTEPVLSLVQSVESAPTSIVDAGATTSIYIDPTVLYTGIDLADFKITITADDGTDIAFNVTSESTTITSFTSPYTRGDADPFILVNNDIGQGFFIAFDQVNTYTPVASLNFTLGINSVPDGTYAYALMWNYAEQQENNTDVRSPLGLVGSVDVRNFNDQGDRISSFAPAIQVPDIPPQTDALEVYRRDDTTASDFVRVFKNIFDEGAGAELVPDFSKISAISPLITADPNVLSELEYNLEIGNNVLPLNAGVNWYAYSKIFSFDGRLFRVPFGRQDLLAYNTLGKILDWPTGNTFTFAGDIVAIKEIRDPTTVGGSLTKVVFTTAGIYNITGTGVISDPYVSSRIVEGINVDGQSVVDANGILMFMSRSPSGAYDEGAYGQKVYEYNLQSLTEVSQRVKNSPAIFGVGLIEWAELIGGDKYMFKKSGVEEILLYHRDAKGWIATTASREATGSWTWESKKFTPEVLQRFKIAYARMIKLDYKGKIDIKFIIFGDDDSQSTTITMAFPDSNPVRKETITRLPNTLGRKWSFTISSAIDNSILYDFYFVL